MYIPKSMKKQIAKVFYDKEISVITSKVTTDAEGGVNTKGYEVKSIFKGNVNFSNCKQIQEDYGLDYDIDISVTTDYESIKIDDVIKYHEVVYKVTDVLKSDSHVLLVAKKWRQLQ